MEISTSSPVGVLYENIAFPSNSAGGQFPFRKADRTTVLDTAGPKITKVYVKYVQLKENRFSKTGGYVFIKLVSPNYYTELCHQYLTPSPQR